MHTLKFSLRPLRSHACSTAYPKRCLSTSHTPSSLPWFVDPSDVPSPKPIATPSRLRQQPVQQPQQQLAPLAPLPTGIAPHTPLARLHARLSGSPFLEPGTLLVTRPLPTEVGPPLPPSGPKGRRKRGRTYVGEGLEGEEEAGLWRWIVIAEVKEGTENRGAIDSVVRQVRQSLLKEDPPVLLPPRRREIKDGWAMIDAGDFAVHVVSKTARSKFFPAEKRMWTLS